MRLSGRLQLPRSGASNCRCAAPAGSAHAAPQQTASHGVRVSLSVEFTAEWPCPPESAHSTGRSAMNWALEVVCLQMATWRSLHLSSAHQRLLLRNFEASTVD